jgi:cellulose synthase/poly-beta-1,6-N-acetylglucosamine synthase-like glycosyltransferase
MQDFEVIVVDDGSTDDATRLLLDDFERPKTRVIRRANHGLAATRNHGIGQARGRYVCCLDADDRLRPDFFAKACAILERDPGVGFVTGYFEMFGDRKGVFRVPSCAFPEMLAHNQAIAASVFRRDAWEKAGGYCETFSASGVEDWDLWITMLELGYRAEVIPEVMCDYRIHPAQMTTTMYQPDTWRRLRREIVLRHRSTYEAHLVDVIGEDGAQWADVRQWANDREGARAWWEAQANAWQRRAEAAERLRGEQQARIRELDRGIAWLEEQGRVWQGKAERGAAAFEDQRVWIAELERGKTWLEEQWRVWQERAEERAQQVAAQQVRIAELEQGRVWLDEQRAVWQGRAEEGARVFEEQRAWIEELERAKAWLEEQRAVWQRLAEEAGRLLEAQRAAASTEDPQRTDVDD